jgi:predicted Kef-type K+ transport protein
MSLLLKVLIALIIGVIVAFIAGKVCQHFNLDMFWGWLAGVVAGIFYFVNGNGLPTTLR